jgi:integrase
MFTIPGTDARARIGLGTYSPAFGLKAARDAANLARVKVEAGIDPRINLAPPVRTTVRTLFDEYMTMHGDKLRTANEVRRVFNRDVLPLVGDISVSDFRITHLNKVTDPIVLRGCQSQAAQTFRLVRALINFAVRRGVLEYSPISKAVSPKGGDPRERFLVPEEIRVVWQELPSALAGSLYVPTVLRLCLATGQRVGEVAGMRRAEIDLANAIWTIPKERVKNKHAHTVPLPPLALELVREAMRETNGDILFPNEAGDAPLSHRVMDRAISRAQRPRTGQPLGKFGIPRWTPHDLRRTVSTMASIEEYGLRLADAYMDHVLNHRSATKSTVRQRHYSHHAFLSEKRAALAEWDAFLAHIVDSERAGSMKLAA